MHDCRLPHHHSGDAETLAERIPEPYEFSIVAQLLKQLSDENRIRIFWILCHCEECVINISAMVEMSSPAVAHHLRSLKAAGLICSRRSGKEVYYRASDTPEAQALHIMIEQLVDITCPEKEKLLESARFRQTEIIHEIHDLLTADPARRYTIEELSRQFLINTSALKAVFKATYGMPIAAYMKRFRMERAMELLAGSDSSIAEIAAKVGYESQSKFTETFKAAAGMLPSEYRRQGSAQPALAEHMEEGE